jgi:AcrR family transcriptional regulator
VSPEQILRRASYGPNSPAVLERGARTRQRILAEALRLFEEKGYYGTLSDDIAERVGIARATLYQYFDSKEAIFRELMEECAAALLRPIRHLGPLGPTEEGFQHLHQWLCEWSEVHKRYAAVFAQWSLAARSGALSVSIRRFLTTYSSRIGERLGAVAGIDPQRSALMLTTAVNRVFLHRAAGELNPLSEQQVIDSLATALQLMAFPDTPSNALTRIVPDPPPDLPPLAETTRLAQSSRFDDAGHRARITVDRLLDASCEVFADQGYHLATVDDIVTRAGIARGTFYKYFRDKPDLLRSVLDRCHQDLSQILADIAGVRADDENLHEELLTFLGGFAPWHRRYAGALRVDPDAMTRMVTDRITQAFEKPLATVQRDYHLSRRVAATMMTAMVGRGLEGAPMRSPRSTHDDATLHFVATLIERGLFNQRGQAASPPIGSTPR